MQLIHDGKKVTALVGDNAQVMTQRTVFAGTQAECDAEIARLGLEQRVQAGTRTTKSQQAADYFRALSPAMQQKFGLLFLALSAQTDDRQKALAIGALVPVNDDEREAQAALLGIFGAG